MGVFKAWSNLSNLVKTEKADYNGLGEDFVSLAMRRSSINFEASCHGIEIY